MAGNTVPIHGKICRTAYGTPGAGTLMDYTDGWSVNVTLDTVDASRQGQSWKELLAGQAGWTASFSGSLVLGDSVQYTVYTNLITSTPGTKLTGSSALYFQLEDTGDYLTGDSFITGVSFDARVADKVSFTVNVQGTGELSLTAS